MCGHPGFWDDPKTLAILLILPASGEAGSWDRAEKETSHLIPELAGTCLCALQGTEPGLDIGDKEHISLWAQRRADVGILAGAAVTSPSSCLHGCKTVAAPPPSVASTQEGGPCKLRKPAEREGLFQKPFSLHARAISGAGSHSPTQLQGRLGHGGFQQRLDALDEIEALVRKKTEGVEAGGAACVPFEFCARRLHHLRQTALSSSAGGCAGGQVAGAAPVAHSLHLSHSLGLHTRSPMGAGCRHSLERGGSRQHGLPSSCSGRMGICQGQVRWQMVAEGVAVCKVMK